MDFTKEQKDAAFKAAEKNDIKGVLTAIFGETQEKDNRPVIERVKTFEDAVKELGDSHPLVNIYHNIVNEYPDDEMKPMVDYIKVCIIVAALNEGWEPKFVKGEYRWAPWFSLLTNEDIDKMNDEDKEEICRVVGRSGSSADAFGGLAYAYASHASSYSNTHHGSRLAFKNEDLAEYAGKQFIEEYYQLNVGL